MKRLETERTVVIPADMLFQCSGPEACVWIHTSRVRN